MAEEYEAVFGAQSLTDPISDDELTIGMEDSSGVEDQIDQAQQIKATRKKFLEEAKEELGESEVPSFGVLPDETQKLPKELDELVNRNSAKSLYAR